MKNDKVIKSVSNSQAEILFNIMHLYNRGRGFFLDITFSRGNFYGDFEVDGERIIIPQPQLKYDVNPLPESTVEKIYADRPLPIDDNTIDSLVFDPPFIVQGNIDERKLKKESAKMCQRFDYYISKEALLTSYYAWMKEINRVLTTDGILIVKCQMNVVGYVQLNSPFWICFLAECLGMELLDTFYLIAEKRLTDNRKQHHSRRYESTFLVFRNTNKRKVRLFSGLDSTQINELLDGFQRHNEPIDKSIKKIDRTHITNITRRVKTDDIEIIKSTILKLKTEGFSNCEIARKLDISEGKVRYQLHKIGYQCKGK